MRIVSYNVNGIRAAIKKGLIEWLKEYKVDILCVQETKASSTDIDLSLLLILVTILHGVLHKKRIQWRCGI